ncbi:MAG TPA: hypothetical protein VLV54_00160 [Thermoanaerobaculia bacterium]|nr:hypothetical protein [Thermoanaerobaculia bacterium]
MSRFGTAIILGGFLLLGASWSLAASDTPKTQRHARRKAVASKPATSKSSNADVSLENLYVDSEIGQVFTVNLGRPDQRATAEEVASLGSVQVYQLGGNELEPPAATEPAPQADPADAADATDPAADDEAAPAPETEEAPEAAEAPEAEEMEPAAEAPAEEPAAEPAAAPEAAPPAAQPDPSAAKPPAAKEASPKTPPPAATPQAPPPPPPPIR